MQHTPNLSYFNICASEQASHHSTLLWTLCKSAGQIPNRNRLYAISKDSSEAHHRVPEAPVAPQFRGPESPRAICQFPYTHLTFLPEPFRIAADKNVASHPFIHAASAMRTEFPLGCRRLHSVSPSVFKISARRHAVSAIQYHLCRFRTDIVSDIVCVVTHDLGSNIPMHVYLSK